MGKVKNEFFDYAEDNLINELQIDDALANDDFNNNHISNTNKVIRSDNDDEINKTKYTIQSLYKKAKDENPIKYEETKCEVCATTVNVNEYNSRHDDAVYSNNKYTLCLEHAIEMKKFEIENYFGKGTSLVAQHQFAKVISELQSMNDDDEQIEIYNQYASKLLTPKINKVFNLDDVKKIKNLIDEAPNCEAFIEHVALSIYSSIALNNKFERRISPVLLLGEAGVGKTHIANRMSYVLGMDYNNIQISSLHSSFEFVGLSHKWRSSSLGLYSKALIQMKTNSGIVVLDEIDKASSGKEHGSIYEPLLQLLEIDTCDTFQDAYLPGLNLHSNDIFFVATANAIQNIPTAVLSRFDIIEIEQPTPKQLKVLIEKIYKNEIQPWLKIGFLYNPLNRKIIELLQNGSVREIKNKLKLAVAKSAYANKNQTKKIIDLNISHFLSDDFFDKLLQKAIFENNLMH